MRAFARQLALHLACGIGTGVGIAATVIGFIAVRLWALG